MFRVNVHTEEQLTTDELKLLFTIARAVAQRNDTLFNTDIYRKVHEMTEEGYPALDDDEQPIVHTESLPKEQFVDVVQKGMCGTITISVQNDEGEHLERKVPILPVVLINIPNAANACIYPTEIMEYSAVVTQTGLSFGFCGDLLDFVRLDKDWRDNERTMKPLE